MLNLAIVGCGGMANWHAQQIQKIPEIKVTALVDNVPAQTKTFKEKYFADAAEYESFETLLEKPPARLDAVLLVTPHTLHYPQAKMALEHGLHVMVEKPMVTSSVHAYDLWKTVKLSGKQLAITFQSPYTEVFGYLADEREAGKLGKVQLIQGFLSQSWLTGTRGKWRQEPALSGGGQMYDSGAHLLNAMMWLLNESVVEVACFYDKCGSPVDINGVAALKFESGALGSFAIGGNCPAFLTNIYIETDTMLITSDNYGTRMDMTGKDGKKIYPHVKQEATHPAAGTPHLNFIRALEGKEQLRCPVRYGVLLSALMDALYESADTKKIVKVKPVPKDI
jgi:predicted dehydrogenase